MLLLTEIEGCLLRPWTLRDKPDLVRNANSRRIWRNLTELFPYPYTDADADFWIDYTQHCSPGLHLAIEVDGAVVGSIGVIAGTGISSRTGSFGYWLGERVWGKGFATAAARAFTRYALDRLPFARLESAVFEWNPASMRVLEKAGFVREGVLRKSVFKDGELINCVMYARLRTE